MLPANKRKKKLLNNKTRNRLTPLRPATAANRNPETKRKRERIHRTKLLRADIAAITAAAATAPLKINKAVAMNNPHAFACAIKCALKVAVVVVPRNLRKEAKTKNITITANI